MSVKEEDTSRSRVMARHQSGVHHRSATIHHRPVTMLKNESNGQQNRRTNFLSDILNLKKKKIFHCDDTHGY